MALAEMTFRSYSLRREVTFNALIPADRGFVYGRETLFENREFKTLYMLHGLTGHRLDFLHLTDLGACAEALGLAVVFPSGENTFYLEDEGMGTSHSAYVGRELVDFTRNVFPLSRRREDTFIGGISMGAYGAVINALRHPETFSRVLSLSGAFMELEIADQRENFADEITDEAFQRRVFGDPETLRHSDRDPRFLIEGLLERNRPIPRIRQCCGTEDSLIGVNRTLHEFLESRGVEHFYDEGPGAHDWDYWHPRLEPGLEWLMGE